MVNRFRIPVASFVFVLLLSLCACDEEEESGPEPPEGTPGIDHCQVVGEEPSDDESAILFGDLHAHTQNSLDGQLVTLPIFGRRAYGPADACRFARYCSQLDFWSVNDHAEEMLSQHWRDNIDAVRSCNQDFGGYQRDPEMVTYLGWEWTQSTNDPVTDYGHHNVVLRDTCPAEIPDRPFAAPASFAGIDPEVIPTFRDIVVALDPENEEVYDAAVERVQQFDDKPMCDPDTPTRELPPDCHEVAETPGDLYDRFGAWDLDAIAIPHGTAWGTHHAQLVTWRQRFNPEQLDPTYSPVVEVHSGHGNSEEYQPWRHAHVDDGETVCPEPTDEFEPCCWRAGEITRDRSETCQSEPDGPDCQQEVEEARQAFLDAGKRGFNTIENAEADDWLDCGQCNDCFQPALNLRPERTVQAALAMTNFDDPQDPWRYVFGMVSSTDSHQSGPGAGYKEFTEMTDSSGPVNEDVEPVVEEALARITPDHTRQESFNYGGGFIAVHADAPDRHAIWDAIQRREVYATSGERIELEFDWINPDGENEPMGAQVTTGDNPQFEVRARGGYEQAEGCPEWVVEETSEQFVEQMCFGECFNPTGGRHDITRIEVVRITPQVEEGEPIDALIEDPWKTLECDSSGGETCEVQFTDDEYAAGDRAATYYVRAIQEPTQIFNADTLRCERDEDGNCIDTNPCDSSYTGEDDDCLADGEERAWSSPIYLSPDS